MADKAASVFGVARTAGSAPEARPMARADRLHAIEQSAKSARLRIAALRLALRPGARAHYDGRVDAATKRLKSGIGRSPDVILRRFRVGGDGPEALCAFVDGLAENQMVDQDLMLLAERAGAAAQAPRGKARADAVAEHLSVGHVTSTRKWSDIVAKILAGNAVLLVEGADRALVLDTVKYPARPIASPDAERSVLGSHEGFNEILLTHMNQVRRYVQSPALRFESMTFGSLTGTKAVLVYVDGVTNPAILHAVRRRLEGMKDSTVLSVTRLASTLKDHRWTPFPLVRQTPRVDFVAREVAEGRVAILVANSPFALIVPATFLDFYRTAEDYEGQFWGPTLDRLVRLGAFLIALYAPALYVALSEVNPDFMPTRLLWTVAGSRENLPFPPQIEVLIMFGVFEILREAALRMPSQMSTALSTVGAVIIGTAVVKAGIVSTLIIVVVAIGALGVFTAPTWEATITTRWIFWPMVASAYLYGLAGMAVFTVVLLLHMASLSSFGVPYLSPFGPLRTRDWADSILRAPLRDMRRRPSRLFTLDPRTEQRSAPAATEPDVPLAAARRRRT